MRRFAVLVAIIFCIPLSSYAQGIKIKEDNRAFIRPWLTAGFKSPDVSMDSQVTPVFRGGIFFLRQDRKYGVDLGASWMPASYKYNFRTIVRLKKDLFSDFGADYVHRMNGTFPTDASYIKAGAAFIKENKRNRVELAGGLGIEFLSYNYDGHYLWLSDKHSAMFYSLFRFDHALAGSDKWMLRLENESALIKNAYDPGG